VLSVKGCREDVIVSDVANCVQKHPRHNITPGRTCRTLLNHSSLLHRPKHPSSLQQQPSNSNFTHRGQASNYKGCDKWQGHANTTATTWLAAYQLSAAVCKAGNGHGLRLSMSCLMGCHVGSSSPDVPALMLAALHSATLDAV